MAKHQCDLNRLCTALGHDRRVLQPYREFRRRATRQYVGKNWSNDGAEKEVPVNLLALYVNIVGRNLIAKNPRVMLSIFDRMLKAPVSAMQDWCNKEIEHVNLANTLKRVVLDGLFSMGITKVALATPADAATHMWNQAVGVPFAARVDLDDFVFDTHARDLTEAAYIGHRYRAPLSAIKDSKLYSKRRKELTAQPDAMYNAQGDERINMLGRGATEGQNEEFLDYIDLWEIYVPSENCVFTLEDDFVSGAATGGGYDFDPLRAQDWIGPATGPYHVLGYGTVPGNAMPKAPIQDLIDIHETVNKAYRKLNRQADRMKEVLLVTGGATEDATRIENLSDGEIGRCDRPEAAQVRAFGGPNQQLFQYVLHLVDRFSWLAGNLDSMGGLSPQSKTLGQDKLLAENASQAVNDMQQRTVEYTSEVMKAMCWYWWHHPELVMEAETPLPGMPEYAIQRRVEPAQRRGPMPNISVDPYSMAASTPQTRMAMLDQMVQQVIIPLMPILQPQGVQFDANAYLALKAKYGDMPDLSDIVTIGEPPAPEALGAPSGPESGSMPQETTRNYVRESRSSNTQAGKNKAAVDGMKPSHNGTPQGANA